MSPNGGKIYRNNTPQHQALSYTTNFFRFPSFYGSIIQFDKSFHSKLNQSMKKLQESSFQDSQLYKKRGILSIFSVNTSSKEAGQSIDEAVRKAIITTKEKENRNDSNSSNSSTTPESVQIRNYRSPIELLPYSIRSSINEVFEFRRKLIPLAVDGETEERRDIAHYLAREDLYLRKCLSSDLRYHLRIIILIQ